MTVTVPRMQACAVVYEALDLKTVPVAIFRSEAVKLTFLLPYLFKTHGCVYYLKFFSAEESCVVQNEESNALF